MVLLLVNSANVAKRRDNWSTHTTSRCPTPIVSLSRTRIIIAFRFSTSTDVFCQLLALKVLKRDSSSFQGLGFFGFAKHLHYIIEVFVLQIRGVAVDDQGYICVADSGNNRIQIFHPDGSFLRAFGSWGSGDAEFKGLEGVAIMSNGNVLVCDRENHRVQVF